MRPVEEQESFFHIEHYLVTDQGTREYQQDAGAVEAEGNVAAAVLCDGMGGLSGGERASNLAIDCFFRDLKEQWQPSDIPAFLQQEARCLDQEVHSLTDGNGTRLNAGTTIVCVLVIDSHLYWLSVGDSRIYLLRNGQLKCLTAAHNYKTMLQQRLEAGQIDMNYYNEEIRQGEALTSYLGMGGLAMTDVNTTPFLLQEEDILVLCSDGLYKTLSDEQIQALVEESGGNLKLAGERLMDTARRWGVRGRDNTTVILLKPETKNRPGKSGGV